MRFWWSKYLPGFPAVLLVLAVLGLWAQLCVTESEYDWSYLELPGGGPLHISPELEGPWHEPRGFPFTFSGRWKHLGGGKLTWTGFQINWFLVDLIIALTVAYIVAMEVELRLFPLVRWLYGKKPEQGESG